MALTFVTVDLTQHRDILMRSAHRLYGAAAFVDIPPYLEAEVPPELRHDWRFMRCELG